MKHLWLRAALWPALLLLCLVYGACNSSNPNRAHRGDLIEDKVTAQRVQAAFGAAGKDYAGVQTTVTNGVVILHGAVASPQLRTQAEGVAKSVHRVEKLTNELEVRQPAPLPGEK